MPSMSGLFKCVLSTDSRGMDVTHVDAACMGWDAEIVNTRKPYIGEVFWQREHFVVPFSTKPANINWGAMQHATTIDMVRQIGLQHDKVPKSVALTS